MQMQLKLLVGVLVLLAVSTAWAQESSAAAGGESAKKEDAPVAGEPNQSRGAVEGSAKTGPENVRRVFMSHQKKPRSLLQACRKEAKKLCGEGLAVAKCLSEKSADIEDAVCKTWVSARKDCLADAEKSEKCTKKETPRACLRKLTSAEVSESCANSDFFQAVQMYTRWRRRYEGKKADKKQ